ncbi:MAG TPA: efflux RND transporter periplasmic adaptor subunit [Tepidisphaeraceae bacterium]|nr:efflux RND transporter periplasmic adaptor subunit [Tepidisphaeraceae bacterium]
MDNHQQNNQAPAPNQPHHDAHDEIPKDLPKMRAWSVGLASVVVVVAFAGLFLLGWGPRKKRQADVEEQSKAVYEAKPSVQIALPKHTEKMIDLVLPADARAMQETPIFPRANGYLKRLLVDLGDRVEAGQLLAEIDTPDVDADLLQAKASVSQANASLVKAQNDFQLAQTTLTRYEGFAQAGGVTQQQLDEKRSAFAEAQSALEGAKANVQAAEASVQRLTAAQGFEKVVAPFAGVISARNYDIGALMSANGLPGNKELFRITDTSTLRVFVNVPQAYMTSLKTGEQAQLEVRNFPGKRFTGTIARSAGELDPATRTIRFEIDFPNKDGQLFAGMYGQAHLKINQDQPPMVVPTSALVFDAGGTKVWVVNDKKAYGKKVEVGRDFGAEAEIASGLNGDESVVTNPGTRLGDGVEVEVANQVAAPANKPQQVAIQ